MGIINHNAIIATTWDNKEIKRLKKWIGKLERNDQFHFILGQAFTNSYQTIVLVPDGSKEGWDESERWDNIREKFIKELDKGAYDDGSNSWDYVEIGFGEYGEKILKGNSKNCYNENDYAI